MAVFNIAEPDQGPKCTLTPRVVGTEFGDGYTQRVRDGINFMLEEWDLHFTLRTKAVVTSMDDFFKTHGGADYFDWTSPKGVSRRYICRSWSPVYFHDSNAEMHCTFKEVPA